MNTRATIVGIFVLALGTPSWADPAAVGVATARGTFLINGSNVSGNATLLDGATVTTLKASSRLQFPGGAVLQLAPSAKARVYSNRAVLEQGSGELTGAGGFRLEAGGMRVEPSSSVRLSVADERVVTVAALHGPARVFNSDGAFVSTVDSETALTFEQDQSAAPASMEGCLITVGARYVLLDQGGTTGVELRGNMLAALKDTRIQAKGRKLTCAQPLEGTDRVIQVSDVKNLTGGSCSKAHDRFIAAHPNISTERRINTRCKVIAGVIIAGAAGGITAGVCCKDEKQPVSVQ